MNFSAKHFFSGYFWLFGLIVVLGLSPVQNIVASSAGCVDMDHSVHHHNSISTLNNAGDTNALVNLANVEQIENSECCAKNECAMTHCTSAATAAINSKFNLQFSYVVNRVYKIPNMPLTHIYPSPLYRPPKA